MSEYNYNKYANKPCETVSQSVGGAAVENNRIESIMDSQALVAQCEAKFFCALTERLACEIKRARGIDELANVVGVASGFFIASAEKETAIAKVIAACARNCEKKDGCEQHG